MVEVEAGRLWIGNAGDARDPRGLFDLGFSAVVDLAVDEPPAVLPREMIYCRIPLVDSDGNSDSTLKFAVQTVVGLLAAGKQTIVACSAGMSRSPAIAAAALAVTRETDPDDVLSEVGHARALEVSPPLWEQLTRLIPEVRRPS